MSGFISKDEESIALLAGALALDGQAPWVLYTGNDAPAGAYLGFDETSLSVHASIKFPQTFTANTAYYVFVEAIGYDSFNTCTCEGSNVVALDDRDYNRYWTERMVVTTGPIPSDTLILTIDRAAGPYIKTLLMAVYVTTNANVTMTRTGVAVNLTVPIVMDDSPAVKGNVLANGSFRAGVNAGWCVSTNSQLAMRDIWSSNEGPNGQPCLKLPLGAAAYAGGAIGGPIGIVSSVQTLKPNKAYTLSVWLKTTAGSTAVSFDAINTFEPPEGFAPRQHFGGNWMMATTTWQRLSSPAPSYAVAYPTPDWNISISANGLEGSNLLIANIQIEEGGLTDYAEAHEVEIILSTDKPGNIFLADEALTVKCRSYNAIGRSVAKTLRWEIRDFLSAFIFEDSAILNISPTSIDERQLTLWPDPKWGYFRATYWLDNEDGTERELQFCVIPARTSNTSPASYVGIHPNYSANELATIKRLGFNWSRALSPSGFFRWDRVETSPGQYVFFDVEINRAEGTYGVKTLATLGEGWPSWADDGTGKPDLNKWQKFVTDMVTHYKALTYPVRDWEVWNEPPFTPDFYAQMLYIATEAILAADPGARVIGMGGLPSDKIDATIAALEARYPGWDWKHKLEAVSMHGYPGGANIQACAKYPAAGMPCMNTESGLWDRGGYVGAFSNWVSWGKAVLPFKDATQFYTALQDNVDQIVMTFARSLSAGMTGYYYYDSRTGSVSPDYLQTHPTIIEYDRTIRPKGVAYSIAGALLDGATSRGNVSTDPKSEFLSFDRTSGPIAVLKSSDNQPRKVVVGSSELMLFNVMGDRIPLNSNEIPYGRLPVYLKAPSTVDLVGLLSKGAVSTRTDSASPNLIIAAGPRGPLASPGNFRMRWFAGDDISLPNFGEILNVEQHSPLDAPDPDALLYQFCLDGLTAWSNWSAKTYCDYSNVPTGSYVFRVKCKDRAGNIASADRSIVVGVGVSSPPVTIPPEPPDPSPPVDNSGPTPGNSGEVSTNPFTRTTVQLRWTLAQDNLTPQSDLQYSVYASVNHIDNIAEAESATQVMAPTKNMSSFNVTGLTPKTIWYFAVIVEDAVGNKTAYKFVQRKTKP